MLNIVHNNVYFVHIAAHYYFLQKQDMMRILFYLSVKKQYICQHIKLWTLVPHLTKAMKQKMYTPNKQQCLQDLQYVYQQTSVTSYTAVPSLVAIFLQLVTIEQDTFPSFNQPLLHFFRSVSNQLLLSF